MADGGANGAAAYDIVELEATDKDGLSWHPCQVSLCPRGLGLIVQYGNNKSDEMIADIKEVSARIRVRSTPLQGDDCSSIRQGEHVLATRTSYVNGVYYDAQVEKAIHVRHSKRTHCRCSFTIKWLHHALPEEAFTVPANAIMKLATKSIHLHPTISAFVGMQESPDALDAMPCSMIADGKNWEMDINMLLEQQIKAISTSTDTPLENILKDFVPELKVDVQGQSHSCKIEASLNDSHGASPFLDKLKGSKGSKNKPPSKLKLETPPDPASLIQEELKGSRLLLNPLAARAALASLRSEFPQSPELPARCHENGDMTGQHSTSSLPQGKSPNLRSIAKKLFPASSPPHIVEIPDLSSGAQLNGMEKKNDIRETKRLTRSQIQKRANGVHETSQVTNNDETQLSLAGTRRVTRSRAGVAEKAEAKECNVAVRDHVRPELTKLETFSQSTLKNSLSDNQRAVTSPTNGQINTQRITRSRVKGVEKTGVNGYNAAAIDNELSDKQKAVASPIDDDTSIPYVEDEEGNFGKDGKLVGTHSQKVNLIQNAEKYNNSRKMTRSAARHDTENNDVQPKLKQRKRELTESNLSTEGSGIQRSCSSTRDSKNNELLAEEGESKKMSTRAKTTPKSSESSGEGKRKSATSNKQETRFSPRLRSLSQTKA